MGGGPGAAKAPRGWGDTLNLSFRQLDDHLGDASLSSLGILDIDRYDQAQLLAVGQALEEFRGLRVARERRGEVGRNGDLSRLGVQLEVDVDRVTGSDAGTLTDLVADSEHEFAAHDGNGAAVCEAFDGGADRWPLARSEGGHHLRRNFDPRRGLAGRQNLGPKSHRSTPWPSSPWARSPSARRAARRASGCRTGRGDRSRCHKGARRALRRFRPRGPSASRRSFGSRPW